MAVKIRGGILLARKAFVLENFGREAWDGVLATLPVEDRAVLRGVLIQIGWYPFELNEHLDQAIFSELGKNDSSIFESIGAKSARENLSGSQNPFIQPGNPQAFMKQAGIIYKFYYDTGRREYEVMDSASGILTTYDAETYSKVDCLTVIGWYKEALKMCGAREADIKETQCRAKGDPVCRYEIHWSM
jgi:predicted hydrocarbon binding protein